MWVVRVEDDSTLAESIAARLRKEGHDVDILDSAAKAIKRGIQRSLDIILIDPGAAGWPSFKRCDDAVFTFQSSRWLGATTADALIAVLSAGGDDVLIKPFRSALDEAINVYEPNEIDLGEMAVGGYLPAPAVVAAGYRALQVPLGADVLDRLSRCRSAFTIDRPGNISFGCLQVAAMRFVLEHSGVGLVLLNDFPFVTTESLLDQLSRLRGSRPASPRSAAKTPRPASI
jgi:CheY-like chemotaxis protein